MFDYQFNGEKKHNMIIGQLSYHYYKVNILYEDFETSDTKIVIVSNIRDFFETDANIAKIKNILNKQLSKHFEKEYMDVKWKIPEYIQDIIITHVDIL